MPVPGRSGSTTPDSGGSRSSSGSIGKPKGGASGTTDDPGGVHLSTSRPGQGRTGGSNTSKPTPAGQRSNPASGSKVQSTKGRTVAGTNKTVRSSG